MAIARHDVPGALDPLQGTVVKTGTAAVVPSVAVPFAKPAAHGIAQRDLQNLQRSVECTAYRCIPHVKPDCLFPVSPSGIEIGAQALTRKRCLEIIENLLCVAG